jgi:hypothetical protein
MTAPGTGPLCGTVSCKTISGFPRHSDSVPKEANDHSIKKIIKCFVLMPCSLKLNGGVWIANRTYTEEFDEYKDSTFELADLRPKLLQWEKI